MRNVLLTVVGSDLLPRPPAPPRVTDPNGCHRLAASHKLNASPLRLFYPQPPRLRLFVVFSAFGFIDVNPECDALPHADQAGSDDTP